MSYIVKPRGINIRDNERTVADGFLQESINLQWRDGAYRPIPERLPSGITNTSGKDEILLHKVSDENKINVLMFDSGVLKWFGTIENGTYTAKVTPETITGFPTVTDFDSLSFTILNSLIYFMSSSQEFYYRLQFNEVDEAYEVKDMYAWKDLIPIYDLPPTIRLTVTNTAADPAYAVACGIICIRFTLVLSTGEEVLHTPIYPHILSGFNLSTASAKDALITNIHTFVGSKLDFASPSVFEEEISAINIYASAPKYATKYIGIGNPGVGDEDFLDYINKSAEEPFYLIRTIEEIPANPEDDLTLIQIGSFSDSPIDITIGGSPIPDYYKVDGLTIAAGSVMPVDNFSYHKLFGEITANNGRLIVSDPVTVLSQGHQRALFTEEDFSSKEAYKIETEDGNLNGEASVNNARSALVTSGSDNWFQLRGVLSYPDISASQIDVYDINETQFYTYKSRKNNAHNLSCSFNINALSGYSISVQGGSGATTDPIIIDADYEVLCRYLKVNSRASGANVIAKYDSNNRLQFSEAGEFSVWPAINSYRVGEGKIIFVGSNSVDPGNSDYIAPLLIGSSDGIYTVNFDVTGVQLIQSITKAANLPALSPNNVLIDQNLVYVSDKGLIVINNGVTTNITRDFFPEQGNGNFPAGETTYPNYNVLTNSFFGGPNPYTLTDIVDYMKEALFAYDGRRNNIWCSNPSKNFSLVFNIGTKQWDFSTYVFSKAVDFLGILDTVQEGEIYSRFLTYNESGDLDILSGENPDVEIDTHLLTRPIKMQAPDQYKKIQRLISRSELYRSSANGYFSFGLWGKQDLNRDKTNIPLVAYSDNSATAFPNDIRQDIPIGRQKGKYKTITILQSGKLLPSSSLDNFEIVALAVDNNILR